MIALAGSPSFCVVNCGIPEAPRFKEKLSPGPIFCLLCFSAWSCRAVKHRTSLLCYLAKDAQLEKRLWQMYTSGKPHYAKKWSQQHGIASSQSFPLSTPLPQCLAFGTSSNHVSLCFCPPSKNTCVNIYVLRLYHDIIGCMFQCVWVI